MSEEKKELINEELNDEKKELTQEELEQVTGGANEQEMIARQNPKVIANGVIMKAVCGSIDKAAIKR